MPSRALLRLQQLSAANFWTKLGLLAALGVPNVVVCAVAYKFASGVAWHAALFKAYGVLYRVPGVRITGESTTAAAVVLHVIFMFGMFVFGILLGTIADEVKSQLKLLRSGRKPLNAKGHMLILNWNQKLIPMLRQISAAKPHAAGTLWSCPVVVLADKPKPEMDAAIADGLKIHNLEIHTRSGSPLRCKHLARVSAAHAAAVILLEPEGASGAGAADACQATAAVALSSVGQGAVARRIVVQAPEVGAAGVGHLGALLRAGRKVGYGLHVLPLSERTFVERVMAHAALQPGVASVLLELLTPGEAAPQFRFVELTGGVQKYSALRRSYHDAVVCGFISSSDGSLQLNPAEGAIVEGGDTVVLLACTGRTCTPLEPLPPASPRSRNDRASRTNPSQLPASRHIIVASYSPDALGGVAEAFRQFAPQATSISFVTTQVPAALPIDSANCKYEVFTSAAPTSAEALIHAGAARADAVLLLTPPPGLTKQEQDAHTVTAILQVHEAVSQAASSDRLPCHVVAGVHSQSTQELVSHLLDSFALCLVSAELIQADEYVSAMLAQIAAEPKYGKILEELVVSSEGNEIYLKDLAALRLKGSGLVKWRELGEVARATGQTALGVVLAGGNLVLAPLAEHLWKLEDVEKVVVFAEDF